MTLACVAVGTVVVFRLGLASDERNFKLCKYGLDVYLRNTTISKIKVNIDVG